MYKCSKMIRQIWSDYPVFVVMILFTFLAAAISRCNIFDPFKFLFAQFAFIFIPGYTLQRLSGLSYQNSLVRGLVSYATGYSVSIAIYLAMLMISIQQYVIYVYMVISLISALYLYLTKQKAKDGLLEPKEKLYFSFILLATLTISMILFQFANLDPSLKPSNTTFNQDLVFWMRNAVAATKSYPLPELSVAGKEFYYHYFTSINLAFLRFATRIEIFDLCFVYSYLITALLLVSGLYVAFKEFLSSYKIVFVSMCFVLFTQNLDTLTHIFFNHHLLKGSFGFAEGAGMFFFALYYYLRILRKDDCKWTLLSFAVLLFFATSGLKGPLAAVLLVGFGTGSIIMMFFRNRFLFGTISGVALLLVFLFTIGMFVINVHGGPTEGDHAGLSLSAVDTIFHSHYYERIYLFMVGLGMWKPLAYIIIFLVYLISAILIPFVLLVLTFRRRELSDKDIILIVMTLSGIVLGMFVSQAGMSQMYFICITMPLIIIYAMRNIETREDIKKVDLLTKVVFVAGCMLFIIQYAKVNPFSFLSLFRSSQSMTALVEKVRPIKLSEETGLTINAQEIEGLRWLRDKTSSNAIVLSNKVLSPIMGARSFWVSSLSERQAFFESYDYSNVSDEVIRSNKTLIKSFYEGDIDALKCIKGKGVSYAVIFNDIIPNKFPKACDVVFKNDKITIVGL